MIHGCVTLDEVFAAAGVRGASLVPETSGYLALAVGDATSRLPFAIDDRLVMLTTEGNVGITKRGEVLPPKQAAAGLRSVLARLLAVSTGTAMPALSVAGRARDEESDRGVDSVVEEIEAALIPVNRAAARRALARLARETIRAKESGKLKPRRPRVADAARKAEPAAPAQREMEPPRAPAPPPQEALPKVAVPPPAPVMESKAIEPPPRASRSHVVAHEPAPQVATEATTPPPIEVAPEASVPIVILPTPPPVPVLRRDMAREVAPPVAEPTPTLLGMGAVEIDGPPLEHSDHEDVIVGAPTIAIEAADEIDEEESIATVQAPPVRATEAVTPAERAVLAQPSEDPDLAFELDFRGPRAALGEPLTPPFALEVALRAAPAVAARPLSGRFIPAPDTGSRTDDLLARFGASCVDDARMAQAAACLRHMAGVDPTPPPSHVELDASPDPETRMRVVPLRARDLETPVPPRARRGGSGMSVGLAVAVLAIGIAGGGAVVRLRPDLFGIARPSAAAAPSAEPAATPPAATAAPQGAVAPSWKPGGGARADRAAAAERAR